MNPTRTTAWAIAAIAALWSMSAAAQDAQAPVWTEAPTRVDRSSQAYERLPAKHQKPVNVDLFPLRLEAQAPYRVIDSVSFSQGKKRFRLAGLDPVPSTKTCRGADGSRWACGLRARALLSGLLSGRTLRCAPRGETEEFAIVECLRNDQDLGQAIVSEGHAYVGLTGARYRSVEEEARRARSGVWAAENAVN